MTNLEDAYLFSSTFLTVSVSGPTHKRYAPGNTDLRIAVAIGGYLDGKKDPLPPGNNLKFFILLDQIYWISMETLMERGASSSW